MAVAVAVTVAVVATIVARTAVRVVKRADRKAADEAKMQGLSRSGCGAVSTDPGQGRGRGFAHRKGITRDRGEERSSTR